MRLSKRLSNDSWLPLYQPIYLNDPINKDSALFCTNTNKINTKKIDYKRPLICSYTEPENSPKNSILAHGNYMYINFSGDFYKIISGEREVLPSKYNTIVKEFTGKGIVVKICVSMVVIYKWIFFIELLI